MVDKGLDGRGIYRAVYSSIWDDPDFQQLTPEEKLILLNLRTGPLSNMPVIYHYYTEAIQRQTGVSATVINRVLDTLCHTPSDSPWIGLQDGIVWVRKGLKYDPAIYLNNPLHVKAIKNILLSFPKLQIVKDFIDFYQLDIPYPIPSHIPSDKPYNIPSTIGLGIPNASLLYGKQDKDKDKDKDKDIKTDFSLFWQLYPIKKEKPKALKEWQKLKPNLEIILSALKTQIEHKKKSDLKNKFCPEFPYPERWLRNRRWEDEIEPTKPKPQETEKSQVFCNLCKKAFPITQFTTHECTETPKKIEPPTSKPEEAPKPTLDTRTEEEFNQSLRDTYPPIYEKTIKEINEWLDLNPNTFKDVTKKRKFILNRFIQTHAQTKELGPQPGRASGPEGVDKP
jgi:hypothetical protein